MKGIFISYRRDDASGYSRLLYDRLVREFGKDQVFMDVESIREPGTDFVDAINSNVGQCAVLLALIGRTWVSGTDRDGRRRLDDTADFVRLEVASALRRDVRVIPIVVQGARMPGTDDLPDDLKMLARRQALNLSHEDWEYDIGKLIAALAKIPGLERRQTTGTTSRSGQPRRPRPPEPPARSSNAKTAIIAVLGTLVAAFAVLMWIGIAMDDTKPPEPEKQTLIGGQDRPTAGPGTPAIDTEIPAVARTKPQRTGPVFSQDVATAQRLLAELDYSPGGADGLLGSATVSAVRDYQRDTGLSVTGRVNDTLIAQLRETVASRASEPVRYTPPAQTIDLSGTWYDESGAPVMLEQSGASLRVGAFDPMSAQFVQIGTGTIAGNAITIRYANAVLGISGTVVATLAADGEHLNGTDTMDGTGYSTPNTWHREHMPGQ